MEHGSPLRLQDGSHVVHFYEDEQGLVRVVAAYLAAALLDGDQAIVVSTSDHRQHLEAGLAGAGVDLTGAVRDGQLMLLDADEALNKFMAAGTPSPILFDGTIGSHVRRLAERRRPVRAYGEMVARLWQEGNVAGAVQLEGLWNQLAERTPFGLFCAYPLELMSDDSACEAFGAVCDLHSHVIDGAPDPHAELTRRFVANPHAARLARRYVSTIVREWGYTSLEDDAVIVVGELVANAIQHGGRHFAVGLARTAVGVRVMVSDSSPAAPRLGEPPTLGTRGRGLRMVDTVTKRWDFHLDGGGKVVSVELAGGPAPSEQVLWQ